MMELKVVLDFACHTCLLAVKVTLKCTAQKYVFAQPVAATVEVPCPHCSHQNLLTFNPNGTVLAVAPLPARYCQRWEPSTN